MTEFVNMDLLAECISLMGAALVCGAGLSSIATALTWAISSGLRILHKMS